MGSQAVGEALNLDIQSNVSHRRATEISVYKFSLSMSVASSSHLKLRNLTVT